jgi:hypothetical protein
LCRALYRVCIHVGVYADVVQASCRLCASFRAGVYAGSGGAIKQVIRPRVSLDTIY